MITWQQEWRSISNRIKGLANAASFLFHSLPGIDGDLYDAGNAFVVPNALDILKHLKAYEAAHSSNLPPAAKASLSRFLYDTNNMLTGVPAKGLAGVQGTVTALISFETEFNHLLQDHDSLAKRLAERAFVHLQQSIIVDETVAAKWKKAFSLDEPACERLGAVHLLSHGIWAFKASADGARTDLVLGEPLQVTSQLREASEALVLTEWKLAKSQAEVATKLKQALAQASQYSAGILAGFELSSVRYLILVSDNILPMPPDVTVGEASYRHINIAVSPVVPSKSKVVVN